MCGLCGMAYTKGQNKLNPRVLRAMAQTLIHRGPNDEGTYMDQQVGLGHRRLSIIDLSGGHQPMTNEDRSLWIVFNGEIYNFLELRKEAEARGHQFMTRTDTEVILHFYEDYGTDCLRHLRGMFAFALWDIPRQRLFLARDRLGKKPLVYAEIPGGVVFASELRALLEHPQVPRAINLEAIHYYLTLQYIPSPMTIYQGVWKLPPGHFLIWHQGKSRIERYWDLHFLPKVQLSETEAMEHLWDKLREAVKLRMIADVPLGAFLSGGLDSSTIVGLMSECSSQPVKTFSIGFSEQDFSELKYAQLVAKHFGCDHHEFIVKPEAVEILPKLVWQYSEPYADNSALPTYYVSKETRKHVTVALTGDGGDENFAGYRRYQAMALMALWGWMPITLRQRLYGCIRQLPDPYSHAHPLRWLKRFLELGTIPSLDRYLRTISCFFEDQKALLYSPHMRTQMGQVSIRRWLQAIESRHSSLDWLDPLLYVDFMTYLPDCLMVKMDIATMANSLEARSPFLDHQLVEVVANFPSTWKLRSLIRSKYLLRKRLAHFLPKPILERGKQGFTPPVGLWFRSELASFLREILLAPRAMERGYFEPGIVKDLVEQHCAGRADYGSRLWTLLMLELWHRVFIDGDLKPSSS